jgi:hypothetical protein
VADSLYRDFHLDESDLSHLILSSIPFQAPFGLKNQTTTQRNILLADLLAAESTRKGAVVEGTNAKFSLAWKRYKTYLNSIGITHDCYLDNFSRDKTHKILGAFCQAIREGRLHSKSRRTHKSDSVRSALDNVSQAFKLAARPDPRLDRDGKFAFILQRQLRGYKSSDIPEKRQIAISGSVLWEFYRLALSRMDKARCELFIGAFFFAMCSCEYLSVSDQRKTKLLVFRNIRFFIGKRRAHHDDKNLHLSTSVSITFEEQKRGSKNDTITHHCTNDPLLCPVKIWARIIKRLISYPSTTSETPVNAADSLGPDKLGYTSDQIGLHSARSGAAMAMYLAGVPVFTIMLLGRWSSGAFLRYIRKEVQEFSNSVSSKMIKSENFFTLSDSHDSNDLLCTGSRNKFGPNFKDALQPLIRTFKAVRVT